MNKDNLFDLVKYVSGLEESKIIYSEENVPSPELPYMTLKIISGETSGTSFISPPDDTTGLATYTDDDSAVVSVQYFGNDSYNILNHFIKKMKTNTVRSFSHNLGIVFVDLVSSVNNLTELDNTQFEDRAGCDIKFRYASQIDDDHGVIESVEITNTKFNKGE